MLFGPAYKGIPLAAITTVALQREHGLSKSYAYNRKEAKDVSCSSCGSVVDPFDTDSRQPTPSPSPLHPHNGEAQS